jgi:hypothetical protein
VWLFVTTKISLLCRCLAMDLFSGSIHSSFHFLVTATCSGSSRVGWSVRFGVVPLVWLEHLFSHLWWGCVVSTATLQFSRGLQRRGGAIQDMQHAGNRLQCCCSHDTSVCYALYSALSNLTDSAECNITWLHYNDHFIIFRSWMLQIVTWELQAIAGHFYIYRFCAKK